MLSDGIVLPSFFCYNASINPNFQAVSIVKDSEVTDKIVLQKYPITS